MLSGTLILIGGWVLVLIASIPTTREILKNGNRTDPLRAEIEKEEQDRAA